MEKQDQTRLLCGLLTVIVLSVCLFACSEKDVPYVIDEDEIARYLAEDSEARELFRSDNLIISAPYRTPLDDATYYDSLMSQDREMLFVVMDSTVDYAELGWLREAMVFVNDKFQVRTLRISGEDTTEYDHQRLLSRTAFFLKLGDDAHDYVGWKLWGLGKPKGYAPPVSVTVTPDSGFPYAGDTSLYVDTPYAVHRRADSAFKYVKLSDIQYVPKGSRLIVTTEHDYPGSDPRRYYHLISAAEDSGFMTRPMTQIDRLHYIDTIKTPDTNKVQFNIVMMQSFVDTTFQLYKAWIFPYRVYQ
jgi:hypothetical protein